jgi:2-(1,2-epoxy-1,2-dihydrophenyl)acetyl-CoA isomerase
MSDHLKLDIDDDGIAWIRFRRPEALNAISVALAEGLHEAAKTIAADRKVRVVVLGGEGRAFMAGGDLQAFRADLGHADQVAHAMIDPLHAALRLFAQGDAPVLASIQGAAAGAGMSLALGADLAIAADDAKFGMAYARLGTSPDGGGSWHLAQLVGLRRAMEIALLADTLDAATALALGLVNRVVPRAELEAQTLALAKRLAQGPTRAFGETRRLLRAAVTQPLAAQLDAEREAFARCARTEDFAEGVAAFFERRSGRFLGH